MYMKFKVSLEGYLPQLGEYVVDADSEEEAEEIALAIAEDEPWEIDWIDCDPSCRRNEVTEVEEFDEDEDVEQ